MPSVLIVNRTRVNAEALASAFKQDEPRMKLVASGVSDARAVARECAPDIAVIELDVAIGLRLVRDLLGARPTLRVFVYGAVDDERELEAWAEAGANCIVMSSVPLADFVRSVRLEASFATPTTPTAVVQRLDRSTTLRRDQYPRSAELTQRERDVLQLIALGLSNREVAETLCVELSTVKNHVQHLMRKLGVHRRTDAARHVLEDYADSGECHDPIVDALAEVDDGRAAGFVL